MKKIILLVFTVATMAILTGCGTTNVNCNYKGMDTVHGRPIAYVYTESIGYHLFTIYPIMGDGCITTAFNDFNKEVKRLNGTKVNVVYSTHNSYWYLIPVITWILAPTVSEVAGTVY